MIYSSSRSRDKLHYPEDNCLPVHELFAHKAGKQLSCSSFCRQGCHIFCILRRSSTPPFFISSLFVNHLLLLCINRVLTKKEVRPLQFHIPFFMALAFIFKYGNNNGNVRFDSGQRIWYPCPSIPLLRLSISYPLCIVGYFSRRK